MRTCHQTQSQRENRKCELLGGENRKKTFPKFLRVIYSTIHTADRNISSLRYRTQYSAQMDIRLDYELAKEMCVSL